jgi:HEPN domain-containing protein
VGIATRNDYKSHLGCYHAQQAVEKALKGALTYLQIAFPFTHDLDRLRDLIPSTWDVTRLHQTSFR